MVLVDANEPITRFRVKLLATNTDVDLSWVSTAPGISRGGDAEDDAASSSSSEESHGAAEAGEADPSYQAMLRVWPNRPKGDALVEHLQFALDVALATPEGAADRALAATAVVAAVDEGSSKRVQPSLERFIATEERVAPPRATPSWGVVPLLSTIQLRSETRGATILYSTSGFPGSGASAPDTSEYVMPIVMLRSGRVTLRCCTVNDAGDRSGVVELHYFVVLPSDSH